MNRIFLLAIAAFLMISCKNDIENIEIKSTPILSDWEITKSELNFDINPRDLFFLDSEVGFVVGYNGAIYKTINSGESWQKQDSGTKLHLFSVFFLDNNIGIIGGEAMNGCLDDDCGKGSILLKTTDGGETWSKHFFEDYTRLNSLKFFDELTGLAIIHTPDVPNSRDYYLAKTSDGGISWEFIDLDIRPSYNKFYDVDNVIFIAGENQKIYKSNDLGNTWTTIDTSLDAWNDVINIYFLNENFGFIDGSTSIYKTTDGGLNWEVVDFPFTSLGVFHFYNESEGFNIGIVSAYEGGDFPIFKGSIGYQTQNGGDSWEKSDLNNSISLGSTFFPRRDLGYGINSSFYTIKKK